MRCGKGQIYLATIDLIIQQKVAQCGSAQQPLLRWHLWCCTKWPELEWVPPNEKISKSNLDPLANPSSSANSFPLTLWKPTQYYCANNITPSMWHVEMPKNVSNADCKWIHIIIVFASSYLIQGDVPKHGFLMTHTRKSNNALKSNMHPKQGGSLFILAKQYHWQIKLPLVWCPPYPVPKYLILHLRVGK